MTPPLRLRPRATLTLVVASVAGLAAFGWPLLVRPGAALDSTSAPLVFALLLPLVVGVVVAEVVEGGLDAKALAMLGVLSAIGAALRPLGAGTAGLETVFFLLILGGRVFGPAFGFVLGTTTLFASALLTGGVGPWLPFQMLGAAWVGLGAGLLPAVRGRAELALLAAYGAVASLLYGAALNLSFWPFVLGDRTQLSFDAAAGPLENLHNFALFTLATSLGFDVGRAVTTVVLILVTGTAVLAALRRAARAAFEAPVTFEPDGVEPVRSTASRGGQDPTGARHPGCRQRGDATPEHLLRQGMQIVEVRDTGARHTVQLGGQLELGDQTAHCARQGHHDNGPDPVGDGVAGQDEHGSVATGRGSEPDLTSLHRPSPPSPPQAPTRRRQTRSARRG